MNHPLQRFADSSTVALGARMGQVEIILGQWALTTFFSGKNSGRIQAGQILTASASFPGKCIEA